MSVHLTFSPGCKAFMFEPSAISTSTQHSLLKQQVSNDPPAHIFKKQWLKLNPACSQAPNLGNFDSFVVSEEAMNDDYDSSPPKDDSVLCDKESLVDDNVH